MTVKKPTPEIRCPQCGRPARWSAENRWRPFCSERCRLIDLNRWMNEEHRIPGEPAPLDELGDLNEP